MDICGRKPRGTLTCSSDFLPAAATALRSRRRRSNALCQSVGSKVPQEEQTESVCDLQVGAPQSSSLRERTVREQRPNMHSLWRGGGARFSASNIWGPHLGRHLDAVAGAEGGCSSGAGWRGRTERKGGRGRRVRCDGGRGSFPNAPVSRIGHPRLLWVL